MDHSHSDHGMDTGDIQGAQCKMWMLWSWHIRSYTGFVSSLIAIVLLGIFFEWLRSYAKGVDREILAKETKGRARLGSSRDGSRERGEEVPRLHRSLLYAAIVFVSFFPMLVFMTYNAYSILATVVGAGIGHYLFSEFGAEGNDKGMACH